MRPKAYKWNEVSIFDLKGKDVYQWLQGQITQNVLLATRERPIFFCFCNLNGYIEGIGLLVAIPNGIRIILDSKSLCAFEGRLQNIILEDIQLEKINLPVTLGFGIPLEAKEILVLDQPAWAEWISFDDLKEIDWIDELEWKRLCLLKKMPLMGIDIKEKIFPIELGKSFDSLYINYQKGCYIGQEILVRLHLQGKPRRQWMVFKTTILLEGVIDHPMQEKGLEVTSCTPEIGERYLCGIYVHRNIYMSNHDVLIFNEVDEVIGVKL